MEGVLVVSVLTEVLGVRALSALREACQTGDYSSVALLLRAPTNSLLVALREATAGGAPLSAALTGGVLGERLGVEAVSGLWEAFRTNEFNAVARALCASSNPLLVASRAAVFKRACARCGDMPLVRTMVACGGATTHTPAGEMSLLQAAVMRDDVALARVLSESGGGGGLNHRGPNLWTALYMAALFGADALVRLLLEADGTDPNLGSISGLSPLHAACMRGNAKCVRLLLEAEGTCLDERCDRGETPLVVAVRHGHWVCVYKLLCSDADPNKTNATGAGSGKSCARLSAGQHAPPPLPRARVVACADPHEEPLFADHAKTPLHIACNRADERCVAGLLGARADVNIAAGGSCELALHVACDVGDEGIVRLLIEANGNQNAQSKDGRTPLFVACEKGHVGCARLLLMSPGCRPNVRCNGWTALHSACRLHPNPNIAQVLLVGGADRSAPNDEGVTALQMAVHPVILAMFRMGIDYWQRRRHAQHSPAAQEVVRALLCVQHRLERENPSVTVVLPVEMWLLICTFLRSADFEHRML